MNTILRQIAIASAVSLMAIGSAGAVSAQTSNNGAVAVQGQSKWKFDNDRHERRRFKDDRFRFYFGGFWYPQPYWLGYGLNVKPRLSCGAGRAIVDARYNRVRTIECRGATYTYLGNRHGNSYKVMLNARTGRIVDVDRLS
jgi:hypothetical protein